MSRWSACMSTQQYAVGYFTGLRPLPWPSAEWITAPSVLAFCFAPVAAMAVLLWLSGSDADILVGHTALAIGTYAALWILSGRGGGLTGHHRVGLHRRGGGHRRWDAGPVHRQRPRLGGPLRLHSQHGSGGLLDYPHYTRPAEFGGLRVPETLLNGDHAEIRRWRREQQLRKTLANRPDLLQGAALSRDDLKLLEAIRQEAG